MAEGIETVGPRDEVAKLECDFGQGLYLTPQTRVAIDALVSTYDTLPCIAPAR